MLSFGKHWVISFNLIDLSRNYVIATWKQGRGTTHSLSQRTPQPRFHVAATKLPERRIRNKKIRTLHGINTLQNSTDWLIQSVKGIKIG